MTTLTVAICTTGRLNELNRCLHAITAQTHQPEQVIIAWSGYAEAPSFEVPGVPVLSIAVPRKGLSIARNAALEAASSEIVAFTDDDAVPEPQWCEALRRCFTDGAIGAACGPVLPLDGQIDPRFPTTRANANFDSVRTVSRDDAEWFALVHFGGFVSGANMAVRREIARKGFSFNGALGRGAVIQGGEEQYAFHQIVERGYALRYDPAVVVRHFLPTREEEIAREACRRQRSGVAYIGFLFLGNTTARRALPGWLLHRRFRPSRGFVGVANPRRLRFRARIQGIGDLLKWLLHPTA